METVEGNDNFSPKHNDGNSNPYMKYIAVIMCAITIFSVIQQCSTPVTTPDTQKAEESAHIAIEAAEDYKAVALMFRDTANYWKRQALKSDSLRLIAIKYGTESRAKIRALPKDEKKRIADSSYADVHEWALICADSLKQTKTELEQCTIGRQAMDSAFKNMEASLYAALLRGDTLVYALGQKDTVIQYWQTKAKKERNKKVLWQSSTFILGTLLIFK